VPVVSDAVVPVTDIVNVTVYQATAEANQEVDAIVHEIEAAAGALPNVLPLPPVPPLPVSTPALPTLPPLSTATIPPVPPLP
jgi:hypothetical protein